MNKLSYLGIIVALILAVSGLAAGTTIFASEGESGSEAMKFEAELSGGEQVPAVVTDSMGEAEVMFNEDMSQADFEVKVEDSMAVTQAHLHCAPAGENGPVIAFLFGMIPGGFDVDGNLAEFTLTDVNILAAGEDCDVAVTDIASLAEAMNAGEIYVNVHTVAHPAGEIRGQLMSD